MHELGITQNIVAIASQYARGDRVVRVTLEIGQLSAVMADAIQFCFDVCAQGTPLEGATLNIVEISGRARCCQCQTEFDVDQPFGICPTCSSAHLTIISGQELNLKELETAVCV